MLDNGLVITAIDVQSDNGIQCNAYAQKLEDLVQESPIVITKKLAPGFLANCHTKNNERTSGKEPQTYP